jgi:hypothetical protein
MAVGRAVLRGRSRNQNSAGFQRAFEADPLPSQLVKAGRLDHHTADQITGNQMHQQFFADQRRGFATEHLHLQGGFAVPQE